MIKHRNQFFGSVGLSLFFHILAVVFLQRYSLWFSSPHPAKNTPLLTTIERLEKDQILKRAFTQTSEEEAPFSSSQAEAESLSPLSLQNPILASEQELSSFTLFHSPLPAENLLTFQLVPTFSIPCDPINLLDHLPKDLLLPPSPSPSSPTMLPPPPSAKAEVTLATKTPLTKEEAPTPLISYLAPEGIDIPLTETLKPAQAPSMIPLPQLPQLPTLDDLDTASYSDSFEAELVFLPREDQEGSYIFALTLLPHPDLKLPKIRQHYTFLIDRANSIQQERLSATKWAIQKVLPELAPDDTFNIIAFDNKTEKMAPTSLPCHAKSFATAETFLEQIQLGSFFSSSDLYKPLFLTVPSQVENDEIYTAILLTDGEALGKKQPPRVLLQDWTRYNRGKVTLFALAVGNDPHSAVLDTTAILNKGKLSSAPTSRGLKRKLLKLIKTIHTPVAKNLTCKAICPTPKASVRLYPQPGQAPHLYLDQPYVILGETNTLDDFILFVQGRLKDRWIHIKKKISFVNAKKGSKSLKKEWTLHRAYALYGQYVEDANPKHLAEAEALLEPLDLTHAFR